MNSNNIEGQYLEEKYACQMHILLLKLFLIMICMIISVILWMITLFINSNIFIIGFVFISTTLYKMLDIMHMYIIDFIATNTKFDVQNDVNENEIIIKIKQD